MDCDQLVLIRNELLSGPKRSAAHGFSETRQRTISN
jgi:hypothetical protein